jgi:deoxyadenosine/deoxycytidine kinase
VSGPLSSPPSRPRPRIVAVAGNMGAGKSSLVEWLRVQFGMVAFFEPNEENPYLTDFYGDMKRWAMSSQLFFLVRRFQIHREVVRRAGLDTRPIVQDRTLYEDAEVFAAHLHETGAIDERDWATYQDLYRTLREEIRPPDLMIYLRCPLRTLTQRIRRRGRSFERTIPRAYLASLERLYERWYAGYDLSPTLVIDSDRLDYVERLFDRMELLRAIEDRLGARLEGTPNPPGVIE